MITRYVLNGINNPALTSDNTLHVIGVVSNPARYHSRYKLFRQWADAMNATANVKLHVVELAFGDRQFEVTGVTSGASELQLRSSAELWHKENLINLGAQWLLPKDWRYVAWVDADVWFNRPDWALETLHQLQHYSIVQPWSECADEGPNGNTMQLYRSFCSQSAKGLPLVAKATAGGYPLGHSGFGWACTRTFWENTRGLIDFAVIGSADYHMAWGAVGKVDETLHGQLTDGYARALRAWSKLAYRETRGSVGYVPGTLSHRFHGSKQDRGYKDRWKILVDHKFDPEQDLRRDAQGLLSIYGKPALEAAIRDYMRSRNEDSIDE